MMTRYLTALRLICAFFVIVGFGIYIAGYLSLGINGINAVMSALMATLLMFFANTDPDVLGWVMNIGHIWLQILFWLSHLAAVVIIQTVILSIFGRKLVEWIRLWIGGHKEAYIIIGSNENALMLGEDIATPQQNKGKKKQKRKKSKKFTEDIDTPMQSDGENNQKLKRKPSKERLVLFLIAEEDDAKSMQERVSNFNGIVRVISNTSTLEDNLWKTGLGKTTSYSGRG